MPPRSRSQNGQAKRRRPEKTEEREKPADYWSKLSLPPPPANSSSRPAGYRKAGAKVRSPDISRRWSLKVDRPGYFPQKKRCRQNVISLVFECSLTSDRPDGWGGLTTNDNQALGNPVGIGDGCATVTGYKFSSPLAARLGRREQGCKARSQDTGLVILVGLCRSDHSGDGSTSHFSVKEKDETSLLILGRQRAVIGPSFAAFDGV